jgi:hypothetical protein
MVERIHHELPALLIDPTGKPQQHQLADLTIGVAARPTEGAPAGSVPQSWRPKKRTGPSSLSRLQRWRRFEGHVYRYAQLRHVTARRKDRSRQGGGSKSLAPHARRPPGKPRTSGETSQAVGSRREREAAPGVARLRHHPRPDQYRCPRLQIARPCASVRSMEDPPRRGLTVAANLARVSRGASAPPLRRCGAELLHGFGREEATVTDLVRVARTARNSFYEVFRSAEDCITHGVCLAAEEIFVSLETEHGEGEWPGRSGPPSPASTRRSPPRRCGPSCSWSTPPHVARSRSRGPASQRRSPCCPVGSWPRRVRSARASPAASAARRIPRLGDHHSGVAPGQRRGGRSHATREPGGERVGHRLLPRGRGAGQASLCLGSGPAPSALRGLSPRSGPVQQVEHRERHLGPSSLQRVAMFHRPAPRNRRCDDDDLRVE